MRWNWSSVTGGPEGLSIPPMPDLANMVLGSKAAYEGLMLVYLVVAYVITRWLEASRFGFYLFAIRDNDDAAAAAGINPLMVRSAAMALSAALTGAGGTLFAQYFLYLDPTYVISPELSFQFALLPAVGGLGTAIGPILGSFLITPLSELLRSNLGECRHGSRSASCDLQRRFDCRYAVFSGGRRRRARKTQITKAAAMTALLEVESVSRTFGATRAVDKVAFNVQPGELLGLGSGRMVRGKAHCSI